MGRKDTSAVTMLQLELIMVKHFTVPASQTIYFNNLEVLQHAGTVTIPAGDYTNADVASALQLK